MKCDDCHRPIGAASEARRRAEFRLQPDSTLKVFGHGMPDGELSEASGQLIKVKHNGCYWAAVKRERRGTEM